MRVLQIITHPPFDQARFNMLLEDGWQARTARQLARRYPSFAVESWMAAYVPKSYSFERDGVTYRVFPAQKRILGRGGTTSKELLEALSQEGPETVFHIHGDRALLAYSIMRTKSNLKVAQHHGSFGMSILTPLEAIAFRKLDKFYANSRLKLKYLKRIGLKETQMRQQTVGLDFEVFRPMGKEESRTRLGLPLDKKMMLYVGRFDSSKGLDVIIESYERLKKTYPVSLVAVGGADSDPLYHKLVSLGATTLGRVPYSDMPYYYSAADVMCYYWVSCYGGPVASMQEALACDTPGVSNTLSEFANTDEIERVGLVPKSREDMAVKVAEVFEGKHDFSCRATSGKYYTWDIIIGATVRDYEGKN